jgi:phosphate transport system substrate-binding protein
MKITKLKVITSTILVAAVGFALVGCGGNTDQASNEDLSGSITISGSSALLPLMENSIEDFNQKNPDAEVSAQAGGSGTGLTQVSDGTVDIGNSDMAAEEKLDSAKAKELVDHKVVAQGFAVTVNKSLGVDNLTKDQIQKIFSGKITNWKEVGGKDLPVMVIHRPASSGTRATFVSTILGGKKELENDAIGATQDSNGAVATAMTQNEGAVSYLGLSYLTGDAVKDKIIGIKIDGVAPTKDKIVTGEYAFWAYGHMYTKGEASGISKAFIEYIMSDDNKKNVEELGYISGSEMKVK